jgi:hypothetical protein
MVPCTFLNEGNCTGLVHQRFQEAFLEVKREGKEG